MKLDVLSDVISVITVIRMNFGQVGKELSESITGIRMKMGMLLAPLLVIMKLGMPFVLSALLLFYFA